MPRPERPMLVRPMIRRSGRSITPTSACRPRPSARALTYDTLIPPARQNRLTTASRWSLRMNQIVMPPKMAASPSRSMVESRNAPYLPELPLIRASCPSSMSMKVKNVAVAAPGNSQPIGNIDRVAAAMPTVPATVIMFGVTGVRASPCTMGPNSRAKKGRRKFNMPTRSYWDASVSLLGRGIGGPRCHLSATSWILLMGLVVTRPSGSRCGYESSSSARRRREWRTQAAQEGQDRQARAGNRGPAAYAMSCLSAIRGAGRQR